MKKAVALIELIFAIVIIGLSLLSIPNIIGMSTKSSNEAFTQEAISNGFSFMGMILAQYWDEVVTDPKYNSSILYVKNGDSELEEAKDAYGNLLGIRVGSALSTSRRFAKDINGTKIYATSPSHFGVDVNDTVADDIDDFHNSSTTLQNIESTTPESGDYKDISITMNVKVAYILDSNNYSATSINFDNPFNNISATQSTNIKAITLQITSSNDPTKNIIFRAFSCNIGAGEIKERLF